jgi:hypothetical protein
MGNLKKTEFAAVAIFDCSTQANDLSLPSSQKVVIKKLSALAENILRENVTYILVAGGELILVTSFGFGNRNPPRRSDEYSETAVKMQ